MTRKFFIHACLALAAAALLGACKAGDTAAGGASSNAAGGANAGAAATPTKAAGQQSAAGGTTTVHADGVRRVSVAELQGMLAEGRTVVYDTRAKASYDQEHIRGALSMPHDEVANRAGELPRDKALVFYCT
jgi:activator of HSP90 ATPase